ncbi:MAG: hypothetical protein CMF48_07265 [Legionellales bacterium]|nr:hypothetical protein [Legionellales bacterium]|tara:strand:+ start:341 stop:1603 length:1263 start_codon:yes stop_codon:yes gene_type:complete
MMKPLPSFWPLGLAAGLLVSSSAFATYNTENDLPNRIAESFESAITDGDLGLNFRARVETVDLHNSPDGAAHTLSTTMNYATSSYEQFAALIEFNNVTAHGNRAFNPGMGISPAKASRPVIADPKGSALTRAFLNYDGFPDTQIRVGRQFINLDNQRFVGSREFRQTPQTYDALTIVNHSYPQIEVFYAFVDQVNSVYQGANIGGADRSNISHLFNATWNGFPYGHVVGYAYLINDRHTRSNSSATIGSRFAGETEMAGIMVQYAIEAARQTDAFNNHTDFSADYNLLEVGADLHPVQFKLGYELLSGNRSAGKAFRTPLASHHNFLGKADMFETTPDSGISDIYFLASSTFYDVDFDFGYHRFKPDAGGGRIGTELDLGAWHSFGMYEVGLEYAKFNATSSSGLQDTDKVWLTASVNFA